MPSQLDNLANEYLALMRRRKAGAFRYDPRHPEAGQDGVSAAERHNWNVTAGDMRRIETALAEGRPFTNKAIETGESSIDQINDAVRRMEAGDVSRYNHVPQFLREYYGRKALIEVFGSAEEFPPMDEELRRKLDQMTVRPEFRDALARLIDRGAVDRNGNSLVGRLREYDSYLNQRMLSDTIKPVSAEEAGRIRQKFPGEPGEKMLADNAERQCFIAKSLFMVQLGRVDLIEEDGRRRPYLGPTAELFSHGSRVAFSLPQGDEKTQDMVYDAWQKNALDRGVMFKGRFASHELHRRQVDANGNLYVPFGEIRIRWKNQLKHAQFHKKVTTYVGNYGMNIPLGGMGRSFNRTDCIDDQGSFGHLYVRTRKGDETHCGGVLLGFENAQPKKESCIGQLHNFKALSHDLSSFYSSKTTFGKTIGGRETDLSHISPKDLTGALNQFEAGYKALQERAKTDPRAVSQLEELNRKLCGNRLTALEMADLMTSLGMERENAVRCVRSARSPRDADYSKSGGFYQKNMYELAPKAVKNRAPDMPKATLDEGKKPTARQLSEKDNNRYQSIIAKQLQTDGDPTKKSLASRLSKLLSAHYLREMNRKFDMGSVEGTAEILRRTLALDTQKTSDLLEALQSEESARNKSLEMRDKLYKVSEGSEVTYTKTMKKLLGNMVDPKGHSTPYQTLYKNVKKAAELEQSLLWKNPNERAAAVMKANMKIMEAVREYTAGKESPRKTLKGANTFDSVLDAAACIQHFVPGAKLQNDALIARINRERSPEDRLAPDALEKEYGRGINRNKIKSWEERDSATAALRAPKYKEGLQL